MTDITSKDSYPSFALPMGEGGEKTKKSEWEELEALTKDELIIELVKSRWQFRNIKEVLSELATTGGEGYIYSKGQKPTEEWANKIVKYAEKNHSDGDLYSGDLQVYGMTEKSSESAYEKLLKHNEKEIL